MEGVGGGKNDQKKGVMVDRTIQGWVDYEQKDDKEDDI